MIILIVSLVAWEGDEGIVWEREACKRGLFLLSHNIGDVVVFFISSNLS